MRLCIWLSNCLLIWIRYNRPLLNKLLSPFTTVEKNGPKSGYCSRNLSSRSAINCGWPASGSLPKGLNRVRCRPWASKACIASSGVGRRWESICTAWLFLSMRILGTPLLGPLEKYVNSTYMTNENIPGIGWAFQACTAKVVPILDTLMVNHETQNLTCSESMLISFLSCISIRQALMG